MRAVSNSTLAVLCTLVMACSESPEECGPTASCVPAAGLTVDSVRIVATAGAHPVSGRPVTAGDSVTVIYRITNTGRVPSTGREAEVGGRWLDGQATLIPGLEPGAVWRDSVRLGVTARYLRNSDLVAVTLELETSPGDPVTADDRLTSDSVHLALPILDITVGPPAVPRAQANEPFAMRVTIRNLSAIAAARDIQLRHCMWDYDVACWRGNWALFGTIPVSDIAPGQQQVIDYELSVPPEATYFDISYTYYMNVCVTPRAHTAPYVDVDEMVNRWRCAGAFFLEVWPDFDACPPAMLGNGPVTLAAANCGFYPPAQPPVFMEHRLFVWALDATAGVTYAVSGIGGPLNERADPVTDLDPAADRMRFGRSGRYYFVAHAQSGPRTGRADPLP